MATAEEYAAWIVQNQDKAGTPDFEKVARAYQTAKGSAPQSFRDRSGALDTGNALGTGFWRNMTRLAGLPVDTVANVLDLGKAALGSAYTATLDKAPPSWLDLTDRSKIWGSGENLLNLIRKAGGSSMVDPANPEYEGGFAQAIGGGLTAAVLPATPAQAAINALTGSSSATIGKLAYDATGNPAVAITAAMIPSSLQAALAQAPRLAIRGGEAGRRDMAQRVQDLEQAGVKNPTLGLASGNKIIGGAENLLQNTPGAIKTMGNARQQVINDLKATAESAAANASPVRGALPAGKAIQSGIVEFKDAFKNKQEQLYGGLDKYIRPSTPTDVEATRIAMARLNADIPGAPKLSKFFKNSKMVSLQNALESDVNQTRAVTPSQLKAAIDSGVQNADQLASFLKESTLPYQAIKQTRSLVGKEIADNTILSDVPRSKWNALYGAISDDLRNAASKAGEPATRAFNRANDYTRAGMDRLETLRPFADKTSPEQSFLSTLQNAKENTSILQSIKKSLPESARGTIAGTVIERLGRANPGQQNELGDVWSPERFLTNWNTLQPSARKELFSGFKNAEAVAHDIEAVAKAVSMMRDSSKMWANPSGTAANMAARGMLIGAPLAGVLDWKIPAAAAGMAGGAKLAALAATSPAVRNYALSNEDILTGLLGPTFMGMQGAGLLDQNYQKSGGLLGGR